MKPTAPFIASGVAITVEEDCRARLVVEALHYSRTFPFSLLNVCAWRGGRIIGVCVFATPPHINGYGRYSLPDSTIELSRLVIVPGEGTGAASFLISRALREVERWFPAITHVVSYCDPVERLTVDGEVAKRAHDGAIYRAANGQIVGHSLPKIVLLCPRGTMVTTRTMVDWAKHAKPAALKRLLEQGAPPPNEGESRADWVGRCMQTAPWRRMRHPGNVVFAWKLKQRRAAPARQLEMF